MEENIQVKQLESIAREIDQISKLTPNLIKELDTKLNNSIQEINTIKNNTNDETTIKYSDYLIRCINKLLISRSLK